MQVFKDRNGKDWSLDITLTAATQLKSAGIDIFAMRGGGVEGIGQLYDLPEDPVKMLAALRTLTGCEAIGDSLAGDTLAAAGSALVKAIVDFFPDPDYRAVLTQVMTASAEVRAKVLADAKTQAASLTSKNSSGTGPASSESTQAA